MERLHNTRPLEKVRRNPLKKESEVCQYKTIKKPVGLITLIANEKVLLYLTWGDDISYAEKNLDTLIHGASHPILVEAEKQLKEYFMKKRTAFDLPLETRGTEFQKQVWQQLKKIPYGTHITYGEQARRMGRPKAMRAVGAANGKNPISIIIPCHRVIGASGHLTGFGGGLGIKKQLLELEAQED